METTQYNLESLENEIVFKRAFTDKEVFEQFVFDLFGKKVSIGKIETEKQFHPSVGDVNIKLDIFAETTDHRFLIEIQRVDYDSHFDRFLHYFISMVAEQQKKGLDYKIPQTVLAVIVLTSPYKKNQLTGEPIKDNVMRIDFDPRNLDDERIRLFDHQLLFLNPHKKYINEATPKNFQDWFNLFRRSIEKDIKIRLNMQNRGIAKTIELINEENIDPETRRLMKVAEQRKQVITMEKNESFEKGEKKGLKKGLKKGREEGIGIGMEKGIDTTLVALNMIKKGANDTEIATKTGLSIDKIKSLREMI